MSTDRIIGSPAADAADAADATGRLPGPSSRLIVARHGRTSWNELGLFQGYADIPLDAEGERQAVGLASALAPLNPDRIVVSDLSRARQTAAPLAGATGVPLEIDARLREVDVGRWEGLTRDEVRSRYREEYRAWMAGADLTRGGCETRSEGGRRAADAIVEHLRATGPGRLLVVVAHGLVLRVAIDDLSARGVVDIHGPTPSFDNAAWLELEVTRAPA
jgi:broad specificity phosphatase PhoE